MASSTEPISSSGNWTTASTDSSVVRGAIALIASAFGDNHFATCLGFPTVADKPIFCTFDPLKDSNRESPIESCQPLSPSAIS